MASVATFDRIEALRVLKAHGVGAEEAIGIVDVLEGQVLPQFASKRGESSARGRLTTRINQAFTDITDIRERLTAVETDVRSIRETMATTMATKQDLADLRHDMLLKFGVMLASAVGFLTIVQGFLN